MSLTPGTRLGIYQVTAPIGEGGMGQVFRARDTRLNRDVALKVLPDSFANDADRLARFTREAQTLASLNHPHIAAIYGLEESDGVRALVMELVEGGDLSQRIARGAIPLDEALPIGKQIAEALEAAHEQGIIHRDLKPANIKVRADGTVKVLDFGLAKAMEHAAGSSPSVSMSPTITTPAMTEAGMILGTAAYMSPEQARGKVVDKRADIWAFGCVLYEMLTGQRLFKAEETSDVLAAVLRQDVDWTALPASTPPRLRRLLGRCLDRDPRMRLRDIGEARVEVARSEAGAAETIDAETPVTAAPPSPPPGAGRAWIAATAAVLVAVALAIPTLRHLRETPPPAPPETRTEINTPATGQPASFALSPDGRQIVFVASGDGASRLWLRSLSTTTALPLAGTEGASSPFWSPDNRSIAFFAENALKRLDVGGGAPQTLAPVTSAQGGAWNADGVILFAPSIGTPLMRVAATGGPAAAVTALSPQQQGHVAPHFLSDGRRFLFLALGSPDTIGIYLGAFDGSAPIRLTSGPSAGVALPSGWLLWVRAGTLVAQRLDLAKAALTGEPVTVADKVRAVSVAATGLVAYRTASSSRQLAWFDRSGTARGTLGDPDSNDLSAPRVSPHGRRVAVSRILEGNQDLWLLDGARTSRFSFDAAGDDVPVWSPDGTQVVFQSNRTGLWDLYRKGANGAGVEERLLTSDQTKVPTHWSADGRFLMYFALDPQSGGDLWILPLAGNRTPSVFLKTPFREVYGAFSPDGHWVAYHSNESGRPEVYVRAFVSPEAAGTPASAAPGQRQVSTAGGILPTWRPDGKELYYLNPAGAMMAVPITLTGSTAEPGLPVLLFPTRIVGGGVDAQQGRQYDVGPDGRFLINTVLESAGTMPITLLQNWHPDVRK